MANPSAPPDPWEATTWEGSRRANLLAGARMTLAEKLEWLEEVNALAQRLQKARCERRADTAATESQPK